jgi:phosphoribosylformimino-5-aminoimidazole carboxamide ribotide isomerase
MRVIPVLDLKDDRVVHGVRGERHHYQPVVSILTDTAEPVAVARAFSEKLGLRELYIADLDAIQGCGHHRAIISRLAQQEKMTLLVDAGVTDVGGVLTLLDMGVSRVIIGAETLSSWEALINICAAVPVHRLVFSLDMRAGQVLSRSSQLAALYPLQVLEALRPMGWHEVILLDLARVGTRAGLDRALIGEAQHTYPELALLVGGGIRDVSDLRDLETMGVAGVLVATALHQGTITANDLRSFQSGTYGGPLSHDSP